MARKHNLDEVRIALKKKHDVMLTSNKEVLLLTGQNPKYPKSNDLGNGSWGKIDFLVNHCGFRKVYTDKL